VPKLMDGPTLKLGLARGETLRRVFATSSPVMVSTHPVAALGAAPSSRLIARVIVECPVALGAGFQAGPGPMLLRREHDREQPTNGGVQPIRVGGEQLEPTHCVGPGAQASRGHSIVERLGGLQGERATLIDQQERAQRFTQAPSTREILVGERRRGRYEPVLG
jgi:hypothetical protein